MKIPIGFTYLSTLCIVCIALLLSLFPKPWLSLKYHAAHPVQGSLNRRNNLRSHNNSQDHSPFDILQRREFVDPNHWASVNGQACKVTDCVPRDWQVPEGWAVAPNGIFYDTCNYGLSQRKAVICPMGATPQQCQWRGSGSCHGQCHAGETTLAHSPWGDYWCAPPGQQAFCCQSNTWTPSAGKCGWAQPGDDCPADSKYAVSTRAAPGSSKRQHWCCPYPFEGCHWIGKGTCDDNECSGTDVMVGLDPSGDTGYQCNMYARQKPLCCNSPGNLNSFVPVLVEDLFPTAPPGDDAPAFDLQVLSTTSKPNELMGTDADAFLFVVIDGPPGTVSNVNKRDGSHLEFITGPTHRGQGPQTAHFVCMDDGAESNCHDMHIDGLPGTVLRMPDHLGFAQWAVAHSVRESNHSIPRHLAKRAPVTAQVFELEYSYDFSKVRRDSGPLYVRVDYSDQHQYYTDIVSAAHQKKRDLLPRFWAKNYDDWRQKIKGVRDAVAAIEQIPSIKKNFSDILLYGDDGSKHRCSSGDGFLKASLSGSVHSDFHFGYTLVGTLAPFFLEEAYGYFDSNMSMSGELQFDGKGFVNSRAPTDSRSLFSPVLENYQASHPGIVSFAPQLDLQIDLLGYGQIDGKFGAKFESGSSKTMQLQAPPDLDASGYHGEAVQQVPQDPVFGHIMVNQTDFVNIFAMRLNLEARLNVSISAYGTSDEQAGALFVERAPYVLQVVGNDGVGKPAIISAPQQANVEIISRQPIRPEWEDDAAHPVGILPKRTTIFRGGDAPQGPRKVPDLHGDPLFTDSDLMECSDPGVVLICEFEFEQYAQDSKTPQDPSNPPKRSLFRRIINVYDHLFHRQAGASSGGKGFYRITNPSPNQGRYEGLADLTFVTPTYPAGNNGDALDKQTDRDERISLANPPDCSDTSTTLEGDEGGNFKKMNSEHVIDRTIVASQFFDFALTGILNVGQGSPSSSARTTIPFDHLSQYLKQAYGQWCPQSVRLLVHDLQSSLESALGNALGSTTNPEVMVNLEENLNKLKGRIYGNTGRVMEAKRAENYETPKNKHDFEEALSVYRAPFGMFNQMNSDLVSSKRQAVVKGIEAALRDFDICYSEIHPGGASLMDLWVDFYVPRNRLVADRIRDEIRGTLDNWARAWSPIAANLANPLHKAAEQGVEQVNVLKNSMAQIGLHDHE